MHLRPLFSASFSMFPTSPCYELVINSAVPGVDLITSSVMAQTIWLNYFYSRTYTSFRHQADTHNRSSSPRSPTLHHSRCAPPPTPTLSLHAAPHPHATCLPDVCLSLAPKLWSLKRLLRDLGITGPPGEHLPYWDQIPYTRFLFDFW